jgi:hypothetical protein
LKPKSIFRRFRIVNDDIPLTQSAGSRSSRVCQKLMAAQDSFGECAEYRREKLIDVSKNYMSDFRTHSETRAPSALAGAIFGFRMGS